MKQYPYSVVDLFAGPGGLGEGFSALKDSKLNIFKSVVAIEKDEHAYQTLRLRHFFRSFSGKVPKLYYDYVAGDVTLAELEEKYSKKFKNAEYAVLNDTLGEKNRSKINKKIKERLGEESKWVLVGGPPCQAYSLVGRSRMKGDAGFDTDDRHTLYEEYLNIISEHAPPVFVMENVKGMLSAKIKNKNVITKIIEDLLKLRVKCGRKKDELHYKLYSLVEGDAKFQEKHGKLLNFVVKTEQYGIPQARHRIFILGVRSDLKPKFAPLDRRPAPSLREIIGNLTRLRSTLSKSKDSYDAWKNTIKSFIDSPCHESMKKNEFSQIAAEMKGIVKRNKFPKLHYSKKCKPAEKLEKWYSDKSLHGHTDHVARGHMKSDIYRYFFSTVYAQIFHKSPKIMDFPKCLLPKHANVMNAGRDVAFSDRFRVQLPDATATTVTSHISKDGHYFIHYDPTQCRSLTVREAARIQTFPDNYKFEGNRTSQFHQIGNAVPPLLAYNLSKIVRQILDSM